MRWLSLRGTPDGPSCRSSGRRTGGTPGSALVRPLLYLLVFAVAAILLARGASRRWVLAASVLGPAVVAALTLATLVPESKNLFENGRLIGTVGYYNGAAAFLLVPFWAAIYLCGSRRVNPILRGLVLAGATLCLEVATLTQSRGALVAMAVSLPIFFVLSLARTNAAATRSHDATRQVKAPLH